MANSCRSRFAIEKAKEIIEESLAPQLEKTVKETLQNIEEETTSKKTTEVVSEDVNIEVAPGADLDIEVSGDGGATVAVSGSDSEIDIDSDGESEIDATGGEEDFEADGGEEDLEADSGEADGGEEDFETDNGEEDLEANGEEGLEGDAEEDELFEIIDATKPIKAPTAFSTFHFAIAPPSTAPNHNKVLCRTAVSRV